MAPTICSEQDGRMRSTIRDSRKRIHSAPNSSSVINYVGKVAHKRPGVLISDSRSSVAASPATDETMAKDSSLPKIPSTTAGSQLPGPASDVELNTHNSEQEVPLTTSSNIDNDTNNVQLMNEVDDSTTDSAVIDDGSGIVLEEISEDSRDNQIVESTQIDSDFDYSHHRSKSTLKMSNSNYKKYNARTVVRARYKNLPLRHEFERSVSTDEALVTSDTNYNQLVKPTHCYYTDSVIVRVDRNAIIHDEDSIASSFSTASSSYDEEPASYSPYYSPSKTTKTTGLLEIAVKTVKLIKRNQMLQRRLAQLQTETRAFIQSVLANPENQALREKMARTKQIETS